VLPQKEVQEVFFRIVGQVHLPPSTTYRHQDASWFGRPCDDKRGLVEEGVVVVFLLIDFLGLKECVQIGPRPRRVVAEGKSEVEATHRLDVLGFYCPVPVVKTRQTLERLSNGDVLEVLADDPETLHDMPLLLNRTEHLLLGAVSENGEIRFTIEVKK